MLHLEKQYVTVINKNDLENDVDNDTNTTISLSWHEQVCLSGLRFERYFSW